MAQGLTRTGSRAGDLFPTLGAPLRFSWISMFFGPRILRKQFNLPKRRLAMSTVYTGLGLSLSLSCVFRRRSRRGVCHSVKHAHRELLSKISIAPGDQSM